MKHHRRNSGNGSASVGEITNLPVRYVIDAYSESGASYLSGHLITATKGAAFLTKVFDGEPVKLLLANGEVLAILPQNAEIASRSLTFRDADGRIPPSLLP